VALFREAESRYGVPAEVLGTVSYSLTRLGTPPTARHAAGAPREVGVMGIGSSGKTTVEAGAALSGQTPEQVERDPKANILAAAALLASAAHARDRGRSRDLDEWWDAIEAYGGPLLLDEARALLAKGFVGADDDGGRVTLEVESGDVAEATQELGYPTALWSAAYSGNYKSASRTAADIKYVVIHTTEGSYSGAISWFKDPSAKVSAHYVVRSSDGQITQMVDDSDIAYHDGCFNTNSIGIEHEAYSSQPSKWFTQAMYTASGKLTAWLCDQYGIPKDRQHIMGHGEAPDCSDHTDPGSGWDWDYYMGIVTGSGGGPTGSGGSGGSGGSSSGGAGGSGSGGTGGSTPSAPSSGSLEGVSCEALSGWAVDPSSPAPAVNVELTFDTTWNGASDGSVLANLYRTDLCSELGWCEHGFWLAPPLSLFDGIDHTVYAYGADVSMSNLKPLDGGGKILNCTPPELAGKKRPLTDESALVAAWHFDSFWDELSTDNAVIDALEDGMPLPAQPVLVQADDGSTDVWLLDGSVRRKVPPAGMINWRFAWGSVESRPAAEVASIALGPELGVRPVILRDSLGQAYLLDESPSSWGSGDPIGTAPVPTPEPDLPKLDSRDDSSSRAACAASIAGKRAPASPATWLGLLVGAVAFSRRASTTRRSRAARRRAKS